MDIIEASVASLSSEIFHWYVVFGHWHVLLPQLSEFQNVDKLPVRIERANGFIWYMTDRVILMIGLPKKLLIFLTDILSFVLALLACFLSSTFVQLLFVGTDPNFSLVFLPFIQNLKILKFHSPHYFTVSYTKCQLRCNLDLIYPESQLWPQCTLTALFLTLLTLITPPFRTHRALFI